MLTPLPPETLTHFHLGLLDDPNADFYCSDPFEDGGFETLSGHHALFKADVFRVTRYDDVAKLLSPKPQARVARGYFPAAAEHLNLHNIVFCHLDVDVYKATRSSLEYIAPRLAARSLIVLDDLNRRTQGVERAVEDFLALHPSFLLLPMFPSQGVLLSTSLWSSQRGSRAHIP